jgi:hypothetical protein
LAPIISSAVVDARLHEITIAHDKRLDELQREFVDEERQGANESLIDVYQEKHRQAAQTIAKQMEVENAAFTQQVNALRSLSSK